MSLKTDSQTVKERIAHGDLGRLLYKRKFSGLPDDYKIIDENNHEVWASELAKRYYYETRPRPLIRFSR